jgi:hypothetical protein
MTTAIRQGPLHATTLAPTGTSQSVPAIARIVAIAGAVLIEAILILAVVELTLGLGAERVPGLGADGRPLPSMPAPAPTPSPAP